MSKKKKIGIILILMIIVGYFAYGTLTTAEQEKEKKFISEPLTEDKFELVKFSTVDYPTLTATLYLATDKKNPVFRLYDEIVDGTTVTDIAYKVTEPLKVDTGNGGVDGQSFTVEIYNANGLIIKATDIDYLSGITKGNTDLEYYRIEITYTTDQTKNTDSAKFEIRNEKDDENSKVSSSIMNYFTYKIQAEFTNPTVSNPKIIKEESGITLTAKASATKMRGEYTVSTTGASISDSNTTITTGTTYDTNYEAKDNTEDDPIIKGEFYITGDKSDDGITTIESGVSTPTYTVNPSSGDTLPLLNTDSNKNKWYEASTIISVEEFNEKLGKKPKNAKIYFTATAKSGKTKIIELPISDIVEKVRPKITNITLTNTTLAAFMKALKTTNGTAISDTFDSAEITKKTVSKQDDASSSGITDLTSKLNVKNGDNVDVEFTVDDESIFLNTVNKETTQYGTVQVKYGNQAYSAVYQSTNGTQTTWKAKITYNSSLTSQDLSFNVRDSSSIINSDGTIGNVRIVSGTPFVVPALLGTTKMAPNTGNPAKMVLNTGNPAELEKYYSNNGVNVETESTEALAYIVMFDYDKTMSDKDSSYSYLYPTSDSVNWIGSSSGTFNLGDGHYNYAKVYIVNNAGAILEIAYDGTLNDALSTIKVNSRKPDFYVDTVAPRVTNYNFEKNSDANSELNSLDSTLKTLLFGTGKPYKTGDKVGITATVKEYNMHGTTDTTGIAALNPTAAGTYNIVNGASYEKEGSAIDLTTDLINTTGKVENKMSSTFYDKAGNSFIPPSVDITFDDRKPSPLVTLNGIPADAKNVNNYKYTSNKNLPLDTVTGVPLSVAFVTKGVTSYVGDVRNASSSKINLTSFTGFEVKENLISNLVIQTYSYSGEETKTSDSIILDTQVNGGASIVNESYTTSGSYNVFNLNSLLDSVTELVGLKSFTVTKSGTGSNAKISDNGTEKALGTVISLDDYSNYNDILMPTVYSTLSTPRNYKLLIPKGITGKMNYKINLKDRLGNSKDVIYTVIITGKTNIIGTSKNSKMKITTTISNGSEMKIQARTE